MASNQKQGPPHIKDLKDLRGQGIAARYRHLGPKGPKSVGCDCLIATYRVAAMLAAVGCDRLIATRSRSGDLDLQSLSLSGVLARDRPSPYGN